jgi:hypothetical protein
MKTITLTEEQSLVLRCLLQDEIDAVKEYSLGDLNFELELLELLGGPVEESE